MRFKITAMAIGAGIMAVSAQSLNQQVDVEHDIVATHRDFTKLHQTPAIGLRPISVTPLSYSQRMMAAPVAPTAQLYEPAAWGDTLATSPYKGYAMLGYWPWYHLEASAGYKLIDTDHTRFAAWGQLDGANYSSRGTKYRRTSTAIGADLRQAVGSRSFINAGLAYRFSAFNVPYHTEIPGYLVDGQYGQYVNQVNLDAIWDSSVNKLRYTFGFNYDYFGFYRGDSEWLWPDSPLGTLDPVKENIFGFKATGRLPFRGVSTVGLDVALDVVHDTRTSATAYSFDDHRYNVASDGKTFNHALLTATPRYIFSGKNFKANLGVNVQLGFGDGAVLRLSPDASIVWTPADILTIGGEVTGGRHINSLRSLFKEDYMLAPMLAYHDSYVPLDFTASAMVGPRDGCYAKVYAGYSRAEDWLMPRPGVGNSFFEEQDISGWRWGLKGGYHYKKWAEIEATFEMTEHGYKKGYYRWRDHAKYVASVELTSHPIEKLDVTVGWELRTHRAIYERHIQLLPEPMTDYRRTALGNISDLRVKGNYRYDDRWSFFLSLDNLLSRHPITIGGVGMEGFHGLAGASYKF